MFTTVLDGLSWLCLVLGGLTALIGAIGILRLPDVFCRMHAAGMIDTTGAGLVLLGLALQAPSWLVAVKLALIFIFILVTSPTSTHALARAALDGGVVPKLLPPDGEQNGEVPWKA
jgi:multicomponent Na+:H+ antiporter subunit G